MTDSRDGEKIPYCVREGGQGIDSDSMLDLPLDFKEPIDLEVIENEEGVLVAEDPQSIKKGKVMEVIDDHLFLKEEERKKNLTQDQKDRFKIKDYDSHIFSKAQLNLIKSKKTSIAEHIWHSCLGPNSNSEIGIGCPELRFLYDYYACPNEGVRKKMILEELFPNSNSSYDRGLFAEYKVFFEDLRSKLIFQEKVNSEPSKRYSSESDSIKINPSQVRDLNNQSNNGIPPRVMGLGAILLVLGVGGLYISKDTDLDNFSLEMPNLDQNSQIISNKFSNYLDKMLGRVLVTEVDNSSSDVTSNLPTTMADEIEDRLSKVESSIPQYDSLPSKNNIFNLTKEEEVYTPVPSSPNIKKEKVEKTNDELTSTVDMTPTIKADKNLPDRTLPIPSPKIYSFDPLFGNYRCVDNSNCIDSSGTKVSSDLVIRKQDLEISLQGFKLCGSDLLDNAFNFLISHYKNEGLLEKVQRYEKIQKITCN